MMEARMIYMLAFIGFLVLLRLFERAMEKSVTPFDPFDRITDYRRHMDRERDRNPPPKDLTGRDYDPVAVEHLRRLHERRRRIVPDNGMRRRKDDH
jgi:hypothetical protein